MRTSNHTPNDDVTERTLVLASVRHILAHLAYWMNLMFGDGASARLAKLADFPKLDIRDFVARGSGGRLTEESPLISLLARAYDFTTNGEWSGTLNDLGTTLDDLTPIEALLKKETAISDQRGETHFDPEGIKLLLNVLERSWGRFALASERAINLQQLALLAGLAEKTVRMLARVERKGKRVLQDDRHIHTYKEGARTLVRCSEARRWLARRPDFRPTRFSVVNLEPKTQLALGMTLRQLREKRNLGISELLRRCSLPVELADSYEALEWGWWGTELEVEAFDVAALKRLAMALGMGRPGIFVKSAATILAPFIWQRQIERASK
jgi:hypothetical protein